MEGLTKHDVDAALAVVAAAAGTQNREPFSLDAVDALAEAIPADDVTYLEWRPSNRKPGSYRECPYSEREWLAVEHTPWDAGLNDAVIATLDSYALRDAHYAGSTTPVKISDFVSSRALHATPFYSDVMRPLGVEHELKLFLTAPPGEARYFVLSRAPGRDFDEHDRTLLALLRPHLNRLRQAWEARRRCNGMLTDRELEVLQHVAQGLTNREVAQALFISPATVRTHLEHIYEKLEVRSRAGAVAAAFRL